MLGFPAVSEGWSVGLVSILRDHADITRVGSPLGPAQPSGGQTDRHHRRASIKSTLDVGRCHSFAQAAQRHRPWQIVPLCSTRPSQNNPSNYSN